MVRPESRTETRSLDTAGRREAGFTLVELLISITLFMGIAFVLYSFISGGVGMWRTGERRQDLYERAQTGLDAMAADLWCTFRPQVFEESEPVAMFLADRPGKPLKERSGFDQEQEPMPVLGSRLRFVRTIRGEFQDPITRNSGMVAGATEYYQSSRIDEDDLKDQETGAFKAAGGLMEVVYQAAVPPGPGSDAGMGVLLRGERLPVGGEGSLFVDENVIDPGSWTRIMRPVVGGVLYMGLEFWDQNTEAWESDPGETGVRVEQVWDSTRGILDDFRYYKKGSEKSDIDDMYPERVRITLILARPGDPTMTARLRGGIGKYEKGFRLDRPGGLQLKEEAVVLVGGRELMEIIRTGSTRAKIITRGAFGTPMADHQSGSPVVWGEVFTRVVNIPCFKENHNK